MTGDVARASFSLTGASLRFLGLRPNPEPEVPNNNLGVDKTSYEKQFCLVGSDKTREVYVLFGASAESKLLS